MSEKRRVSACLCCAALSLGSIVYGAAGDDDKDTTIRVTTRPIIVTAYRNTGAYGGGELPEAQKTIITEKQKNLNEINRLFPTEYAALAYSSLKGQGKNRLIERVYDVVHGYFVDDDHTV